MLPNILVPKSVPIRQIIIESSLILFSVVYAFAYRCDTFMHHEFRVHKHLQGTLDEPETKDIPWIKKKVSAGSFIFELPKKVDQGSSLTFIQHCLRKILDVNFPDLVKMVEILYAQIFIYLFAGQVFHLLAACIGSQDVHHQIIPQQVLMTVLLK